MSVVSGKYMDRSIGDFVRACEAYIVLEQRRASPDTALMRLLCDAVRLAREATGDPIAEEAFGSKTMVSTYYAERGLAVQRDQHRHPDHPYGGEDVTWGVVHLASGRLLVPCVLPQRRQARACQMTLLALAVDWRQPWEDMSATPP